MDEVFFTEHLIVKVILLSVLWHAVARLATFIIDLGIKIDRIGSFNIITPHSRGKNQPNNNNPTNQPKKNPQTKTPNTQRFKRMNFS